MFYVAMTRARDYLQIAYTKERLGRAARPSRFVGEVTESIEGGPHGRGRYGRKGR